MSDDQEPEGVAVIRVGLVGCVKSKRPRPAPARDLYVSELFRGRRSYVERSCDQWFILSAKHGLIDPDAILEPYDESLTTATAAQRAAWSARVLSSLERSLGPVAGITFEIHAGRAYTGAGLVAGLLARGATVEQPAAGLRQGEQLSFYKSARQPRAVPQSESQRPEPRPAAGSAPSSRPHGAYAPLYDYLRSRSSDEVTLGFEEIEEILNRPLPNSAYRHRAWWANEQHGTHVHARAWMAAGWAVDAVDPSGRRVRFRMLRPADHGRPSSGPRIRWTTPLPPETQRSAPAPRPHPAPGLDPGCLGLDRGTIAKTILSFGEKLRDGRLGGGAILAPSREADEFLKSDPFAFLVGVIFDQGIRAERAWAAPLELYKRLGHLDPRRMAFDAAAVAHAIGQRPALHRLVGKVPLWVVSAADRVMRHYGGDASRIWSDQPTARELGRRLLEFEGIGEKKAAMAVMILERDLHWIVLDMTGSDVSYDVHLRRVFLRACLADPDDQQAMIEAARRLHPERPGDLDWPAWEIGRRWCRPVMPLCPECVLTAVCPKRIDRAASVAGM